MLPIDEPACPTTCGACLPGGMCCHFGATQIGAWIHLPEVLVRAVAGLVVRDASIARSSGLPVRFALGAIREYQRRISARRPACCRFVPSCSGYAASAIERFGLRRGMRMTVSRLRRCRTSVPRTTPDPVPLAVPR